MRRTSPNNVFRLIWSNVHSALVPVTERSKRSGKSSNGSTPSVNGDNSLVVSQFEYSPTFSLTKLSVIVTAMAFSTYASASAVLPTGGNIVAGSGSISQTDSGMTVTQTTSKMAANWQTFNIGAGNSVNFVQPSASAAAFNRVLGSDVSVIQGNLSANGQVFLVNPNGVLFTPTARVNVGGLVASTLSLSSADFMAGNFNFSGASSSAITNQGDITAVNGGNVALIAAKIVNTGNITANSGSVLLGAGAQVTLDLGGPVKLKVKQSAIDALIENGGAIKADGGLVYLTAQAAGDLAATVINNTGVIEAQTLATGETGQIMLMGGMEYVPSTEVKNRIIANNTIEVGGRLDASAPNGGNGGFIETSAANVKFSDDVDVTTSAAHGLTGSWLIDPFDFTIGAAALGGDITGAALNALLANNDVTIETNTGTNTATNLFSVNTSVTTGDINVNQNVSWGANTLTLSAANNINIYAVMTATGTAGLTMATAVGTGAGQGVLVGVDKSGFILDSRIDMAATTTLIIDGSTYTLLTDEAGLQGMSGAGNYALANNIGSVGNTFIHTPIITFAGKLNGLGHIIYGMTIPAGGATATGGAAAASNAMFSSAAGADLRNLGLEGGSVVGGTTASTLISTASTANVSNSYNTGSVIGTTGTGGLVGTMSTGSIYNSFTTGDVTGTAGVGGLVGGITTGSIVNSFATGNVVGEVGTGGLVGTANGPISCSYATGNVTGYAGTGGLIGAAAGATVTIDQSYATGNVNAAGHSGVGGLAGTTTSGTVTNVYATGNVVGAANTGGLLGTTTGILKNSYSTGDVTGTIPTGMMLGASTALLADNFWNTDAVATGPTGALGIVGAASVNPVGTTGVTNAQLSSATFGTAGPGLGADGNWDFNNIWQLVEGATPILRCTLDKLTVTTFDQSKIYDGSAALAPIVTYSSTQTGSSIASTPSLLTALGALSNTGTSGTAVDASATLYTIIPEYAAQSTYNITYVNGNMTINKAPVTLSATKVYDGDANLVSTDSGTSVNFLTGLVPGETLNYTGATVNDANVATAGKFVSAIILADHVGSGGKASNYSLPTTFTSATAPATVTAAPLTLSATKVYDGGVNLSSTAVTLNGLVGTQALTYTSATVNDANVATAGKFINAIALADDTGVSGGLATNYSLPTTLTSTNAPATIATKALTITGMTASNKAHDGNTIAALVGGTIATGIGTETLSFTGQTGAFSDSNVGTGKLVTVTGTTIASGSGLASNYSLLAQPTGPGGVGLTANITGGGTPPPPPTPPHIHPPVSDVPSLETKNKAIAQLQAHWPHLKTANFLMPYETVPTPVNNNGTGEGLVFVDKPVQSTKSDTTVVGTANQSMPEIQRGNVLVVDNGILYRKKVVAN